MTPVSCRVCGLHVCDRSPGASERRCEAARVRAVSLGSQPPRLQGQGLRREGAGAGHPPRAAALAEQAQGLCAPPHVVKRGLWSVVKYPPPSVAPSSLPSASSSCFGVSYLRRSRHGHCPWTAASAVADLLPSRTGLAFDCHTPVLGCYISPYCKGSHCSPSYSIAPQNVLAFF